MFWFWKIDAFIGLRSSKGYWLSPPSTHLNNLLCKSAPLTDWCASNHPRCNFLMPILNHRCLRCVALVRPSHSFCNGHSCAELSPVLRLLIGTSVLYLPSIVLKLTFYPPSCRHVCHPWTTIPAADLPPLSTMWPSHHCVKLPSSIHYLQALWPWRPSVHPLRWYPFSMQALQPIYFCVLFYTLTTHSSVLLHMQLPLLPVFSPCNPPSTPSSMFAIIPSNITEV